MGRLLALDFGLKRTGIAISDPLKIIATALTTVPTKTLLDFLKEYLEGEDVDLIIIGEPKNLDNTPTYLKEKIDFLSTKITSDFNIKVILVDERFTSKMAVKSMVASGMKKKDRRKKENIDKISATLILQTYMMSL